jgi:hypothetical protein
VVDLVPRVNDISGNKEWYKILYFIIIASDQHLQLLPWVFSLVGWVFKWFKELLTALKK